tara:strand:+ start:349 stop:462 length:114 start_codon:yes stop_codon:yes gene_type:complete
MEEVFKEGSDLRKGGRVEEKTIIELHTHLGSDREEKR